MNVVKLAGGAITVWVEQGTSIHLRAISNDGDPVELSVEEARELARELLRLADLAD